MSLPRNFPKEPGFLDLPIIQDDKEALSRSLKELADMKFALDEAAIVAITDAKGKIIYVNDTFCEISKYSREELLGQDHRLVNSRYHPKAFFKDMWLTISQGKVWKGEIKNRAKDGSHYWVDTTIVPFMDKATGKPYQYIAIRKDISYLKRIEEELRLLNEGLEERVQDRTQELEQANRDISEALTRLQESEKLRETFISALTHDLRTPLVAEQRALELLQSQKQLLPEKLQGLAERLIRNNDDLLNMVNKLLEIYQYEAGQMHLLMEPVDLGELTRECVDKLHPLAEAKEIVLEARIPKARHIVEGDSDQIKRLMVNLVGNAVQHLPPGGQVIIDTEEMGESIRLSIRDDGPGIDPDLLPHLFDRYFAMGQTRKKIGSGLGLSICKMIVKLHQGSIRVESEPGQGTIFFVTLPKKQD